MSYQLLHRRILISLLCAAWLSAMAPKRVSAQTVEIQEGIAQILEQDRLSWLNYLNWAWRWAHLLNTELDTTKLKETLTLRDALEIVYYVRARTEHN